MSFQSGVRQALATASPSAGALRDAIEREHVWTCPTGSEVQDFIPGHYTVIAYSGQLFSRDDTDATTPHDGVTCLVAQGGVRFKADGLRGPVIRSFRVLDFTASPPVSPAAGDSYVVSSGGTGAWATHDGQIAHATARGWSFVVPATFDQVHNEADATIYHRSGGAWVQGLPAMTIADGTITVAKLRHGLGYAVESTTTNDPPASPAVGVAYVVGPSPTGAWAGHAMKVAEWDGAAWIIMSAEIGWRVYDKSTSGDVTYSASGWVSAASGYSQVVVGALNTGTVATNGTYNYSTSTAPTTSNTNSVASISLKAKKAGATFEIEFMCGNRVAANGPQSIAVFLDGGATAIDWTRVNGTSETASAEMAGFKETLILTLPDTSLHTVSIRGARGPSGTSGSVSRFRIIAREIA